MTVLPYTSEHDPAKDIKSLLNFLYDQDNGQFLYRGQTCNCPGPLLPSAHRRYQKTGAIYTCESKEYKKALRKVGRRFIGLVPINFFHESLALFYPRTLSVSNYEKILLERLSNDRFLTRGLIDNPNVFEIVLNNLELKLFHDRLIYWKQVIDYDHRVQIRDMIFNRPFGYLLGQALAQQYGFSSEMLDVTKDPLIAAFFATHNNPDFYTPLADGVGVIYRFSRPESTSSILDLGKYNFYSCPAILDYGELLSNFYVTEDYKDLRNEMEKFLVTSFIDLKQWRRWEALRFSPEMLEATRITRQSAAFLVPDMIYVERKMKGRPLNKGCVLMAIEDCAVRDGTKNFYFRHNRDASLFKDINREYLWPNEEDIFFEMIGNALLMNVVLDNGQILPNRIDLLDPGYCL